MQRNLRRMLPLLSLWLAFACNEMGARDSYRTTDEETKPPAEQSAARELKKEAPVQGGANHDMEGASATHAQPTLEDPGASEGQPVTRAVATLVPTQGNKASGTVTFSAKQAGEIAVTADMTGLPEGVHAYHVHLYGDCSGADGKSAGTHFNLEGSSTKPPSDIARITGNLGELEAEPDGRAKATFTLKHASLSGRYGLLGRSVIVHEKGNDESQPPIGAAGGRLACGTIGIAKSTGEEHAAR